MRRPFKHTPSDSSAVWGLECAAGELSGRCSDLLGWEASCLAAAWPLASSLPFPLLALFPLYPLRGKSGWMDGQEYRQRCREKRAQTQTHEHTNMLLCVTHLLITKIARLTPKITLLANGISRKYPCLSYGDNKASRANILFRPNDPRNNYNRETSNTMLD